MGLNIRKSIKLGKFLKINKTKKGISVTIGGKSFKLTLNDKKKVTASLPGTGISYDTTLGKNGKKGSSKKSSAAQKTPSKTNSEE
ncbi:MAG: DUF4236 domain-containing protein [Ruminococcus sp.]|nr:DUF4236 domain-containing protein [Ruminococcus sp.]